MSRICRLGGRAESHFRLRILYTILPTISPRINSASLQKFATFYYDRKVAETKLFASETAVELR